MGEDDKALGLGNVTFCSLTEELPEPAHIDVHRFLEPHGVATLGTVGQELRIEAVQFR